MGKSWTPSLLCITLALAACRAPEPSLAKSEASTVSRIRKAEDAHGGPRIVDRYQTGKVEETLDQKFKSLTPGFIEVHSVRITERGIGTTGVYLVFKDSTFTGNTRPVRVGLAYLDKPEIQMMRDALQAEREYIDKAAKTPPQNQEEMNWESTEGVRIGVSLLEGSPTYYAHIPVRNGDDSETIGLTLSPEAAESLMTKITGALNLAEGGK